MNKNIIVVLLILFSQNIFSYRQRLAYDVDKLTHEDKVHFVKSHLFYMKQSIETTLKIDKLNKFEVGLIDKYNKLGNLPFIHNKALSIAAAFSFFGGAWAFLNSPDLYQAIPPAKLQQFKKISSALDVKRPMAIIKFWVSVLAGTAFSGVFGYGIYSEDYFNKNTLNIANKGNAIDWTVGRVFWIKELIKSNPEMFKDIVDFKTLTDFLDKFYNAWVQEYNNIGMCAIGMDVDWEKFYKDLTLAN